MVASLAQLYVRDLLRLRAMLFVGTLGLTLRSVPIALRSSRHISMTAASPVAGDVVTVNYTLRPPAEPSTYDQGVVSFVLGGGNYATGLHDTITTMKCGDSVTGVPIDAGFGEFSESACATLDIEQAPAGLKAGMTVMLQVRPSLGSVGVGVGVGVGVEVGRGGRVRWPVPERKCPSRALSACRCPAASSGRG